MLVDWDAWENSFAAFRDLRARFSRSPLPPAGGVQLFPGDCRESLRQLADNSIDSVVTDPPYALVSIVKRFGSPDASPARSEGATGVYTRASSGFMGKQWDTGETAFSVEFWAEVMRVLKPGGHVVAFGASRGYHRLACAIEDAGFEVRDSLMWIYGTGFPKSHDVSKGIDKAAGAEGQKVATGAAVKRMIPGADQNKDGWIKDDGREFVPHDYVPATSEAAEWEGWGTALKPAFEPIILARKPLSEASVAANVLRWRTGALNIDGCRVEGSGERVARAGGMARKANPVYGSFAGVDIPDSVTTEGRWPANVVHDGSDEVVGAFPAQAGAAAPVRKRNGDKFCNTYGSFGGNVDEAASTFRGDAGSAARFFYSAKASKADRAGSKHPTVKPIALMQWLCRLVTPPGGTVLDPFAGSGTTGAAALAEGFNAVLCEREAEYLEDIRRRLNC